MSPLRLAPAPLLLVLSWSATSPASRCNSLRSAMRLPSFAAEWQNRYPASNALDNVVNGTGTSCQFCHERVQGGNGWNAYGWQLRQELAHSSFAQALANVEGLDSDGDADAATNLEEAASDTQPGWTSGPNNTIYYSNGSQTVGVSPPAGILGDMDPRIDLDIDRIELRRTVFRFPQVPIAIGVIRPALLVTNPAAVARPRPATITALRSDRTIYTSTLPVVAPPMSQALVAFPQLYVATTPVHAPEILWTAEIADDDPDVDAESVLIPYP